MSTNQTTAAQMEKVFTASNRETMIAGIVYENTATGKYRALAREVTK